MAMADEGALQAFLQQQNMSGLQLLEQLQKTFKKDYTTDHIKRICEACDPYQVSGKDSAEDVGKYLSDFEPLTGLVSTSYPPSDMTKYFDLTNQCSRFSTCIGSLLSPPATGRGEEFVAINLQKVWELLRLIRGPKQLNYLSTKNMAEKSTNSWKLFIKSRRPILCGGKVMCFGEEKEKSEEFSVALRELTEKVIELPPALYGTLKFLICYAAAGDYIQFFMLKLRKSDGAPILTPVTDMLDMNEQTPTVVLYYIKLYFLILGMDASAGRELPYHLNTETKHGYSTITLTLTGAIKRIPDFEAYCDEFGIEFTDLRKAYEAASLSHGHMIASVRGPRREKVEIDVQVTLVEVTASSSRSAGDSSSPAKRSSSTSMSSGRSKKLKVKGKEMKKMLNEVYQVQTMPLCGEKEPKCEADLRDLAYGVLQALKQLHAAGLVHRDIRYANVLYDYSSNKYVLIDLETVCKDGQVAEFELKCWNGRTLDSESRYTTLSDLHQLGVLLEDLQVKDLSDECMEFIDLLKSKSPGTTAEGLLQHKWITLCAVQKLKGEQSGSAKT